MTDLLKLVRENCTELQQYILTLKYNHGLTWDEMAEVLKKKFPFYANRYKLQWMYEDMLEYLRNTIEFDRIVAATRAQRETSSPEDVPTA